MMLLASLLLALPQGPALLVRNPAGSIQEGIVRVSLPLPRGTYKHLPVVGVGADVAPTVPLVRWPDGSLAVVQVHARLKLPAGARRRIPVRLTDVHAPVARGPQWPVPTALPLRTELLDPWGRKYTARLQPERGLLFASSRVRVRRYRGVHRSVAGAHCFGVTAYATTFAGSRRAELTLVLSNGRHAADPVLGPARFKQFSLVVEDTRWRFRPRLIRENGLRPPNLVKEGERDTWHQPLLGPDPMLYLGDATGKAFRFDVFVDVGATAAERERARVATRAPIEAFAAPAWVRQTRAFGAHGGPAPGPGRGVAASVFLEQAIRSKIDLGPFGSMGDPKDAAANGTPRNGPMLLHNAVRFASHDLLAIAEGMVLQQTLRPPPGQRVRLPAATKALRQGMSKRTLQRPHGFLAADYEHFSVDLLYDYYWLTGDPLARDEIRLVGAGLPAVLRGLPFRTSRGEGWCMQAAVLVARATGDEALVTHVHDRFVATVEPGLGRAPAAYLIRQPAHPAAFDGKEAFDCPWQMAAFAHGAHAMLLQTGDARYAGALLRAGQLIAGPGWVADVGPKYFVSTDGRHAMQPGVGPLEGTALMLVSGLTLAAEIADKESERALFERRAATIFAPYEKVEPERSAMNRWFQLLLDRRARRR